MTGNVTYAGQFSGLTYAKAEVICSNCGKRRILENYTYGEPCRFCGYKRTELIKDLSPKYRLTTDKFPRLACVTHNGEHPFYYKETVNAFVTACLEVMTCGDYEEAKEKEGIK